MVLGRKLARDVDAVQLLGARHPLEERVQRGREVRPPESHQSFGVFASRSPRRPNAVGLSLVKLDSLENNILFVSGIDMFNGTPVLDIKPYLPSVDFALSLKNSEAEELLGHHDKDFLNDTLVRYYIKGDSTDIDSILTHH